MHALLIAILSFPWKICQWLETNMGVALALPESKEAYPCHMLIASEVEDQARP